MVDQEKMADGQLGDALEQLVNARQLEAEALKAKQSLPKKSAVERRIEATRETVIRIQSEAINSILKVLQERDSMSKTWGSLVAALDDSNKSVAKMVETVRVEKDKRIEELNKVIEGQNRVIKVLEEDVSLLRTRIKHLVGG